MKERRAWLDERRAATRSAYDADAPTYDLDEYQGTLHRRFVDRLLDTCPPDGVVLDAPCGTGHYFAQVVESGRRVVGIDQSTGMLAVASAPGSRGGAGARRPAGSRVRRILRCRDVRRRHGERWTRGLAAGPGQPAAGRQAGRVRLPDRRGAGAGTRRRGVRVPGGPRPARRPRRGRRRGRVRRLTTTTRTGPRSSPGSTPRAWRSSRRRTKTDPTGPGAIATSSSGTPATAARRGERPVTSTRPPPRTRATAGASGAPGPAARPFAGPGLRRRRTAPRVRAP